MNATFFMFCLAIIVPNLSEDIADQAKYEALMSLQGTWKVISWVENGVPEKNPEILRYLTLTFRANLAINTKAFTVNDTPKGPGGANVSLIEIDPLGKPKSIDFTFIYAGGFYLKKKYRQLSKGIYSLDGDSLTICIGEVERPSKFESKLKSKTMVIIYLTHQDS